MRGSIILLTTIMVALTTACSHREVAYLTNAQRDTAQDIIQHYAASIMPGDQLYIYVSSETPESVIPFNQETHKYVVETNRLQYNDTSHIAIRDQEHTMTIEGRNLSTQVSGYLVDEKGQIQFPILGIIDVAGLTLEQLNKLIEKKLVDGGYVLVPQVTSRLMNFRVTVLGEVKVPHQIHVDGTRITILEAIAICGDLTDYGIRENVMVMRFDSGKKEYGFLDLTNENMLNSPYYYLHNNDIVYIEPSDLKKKDSDRNENVPRYISMAVGLGNAIRATWGAILTRYRN